MTHNIAREVRDLMQMTVNELRQRYCAVFGEESASHHKEYLWKRIAWRMQVMAEGDISEEARRRAREVACDADLRATAPKDFWAEPAPPPKPLQTVTGRLEIKSDPRLPIASAEIIREYKGRKIIVMVLENGFIYEGQRYRSLSAIAKEVTGSNWNGFDFFGLGKKGNKG